MVGVRIDDGLAVGDVAAILALSPRGRLNQSLDLRIEIPADSESRGRHLTAYRPLADASPSEESLSSGFAESG